MPSSTRGWKVDRRLWRCHKVKRYLPFEALPAPAFLRCDANTCYIRSCVRKRLRSCTKRNHARTLAQRTSIRLREPWVSGSAVILTTWQPLCRPHACKLRMKSVRQRRRRKKTAGSRRCSRTFLFPSHFYLFSSLYFFRLAKEFDRFKNLMETLFFFYFILIVALCVWDIEVENKIGRVLFILRKTEIREIYGSFTTKISLFLQKNWHSTAVNSRKNRIEILDRDLQEKIWELFDCAKYRG